MPVDSRQSDGRWSEGSQIEQPATSESAGERAIRGSRSTVVPIRASAFLGLLALHDDQIGAFIFGLRAKHTDSAVADGAESVKLGSRRLERRRFGL